MRLSRPARSSTARTLGAWLALSLALPAPFAAAQAPPVTDPAAPPAPPAPEATPSPAAEPPQTTELKRDPQDVEVALAGAR